MAATYSVLVRCVSPTCQRWQSVNESDVGAAVCGACGERAAPVDMEAHRASLPVSKDDPTEVAKFQVQSKPKPAGT